MPREIELTGDLTRDVIETAIREFQRLESESSETITVRIDSIGGDSHATLEFARLLEYSKTRSHCIAQTASSGAALIFISGSRRSIRADGYVGIHMPVLHVPFVDLDQDGRVPKKTLEGMRIIHDETAALIRKRLKAPQSLIARIIRSRDAVRFSPHNAVKYGLADDILP